MHSIAAIVGLAEPLASALGSLNHAVLVAAAQGFTIVPVTPALCAGLPTMPPPMALDFTPFELLSPAVASLCQALSAGTAIAYVETEYFGGTGSQSSVVWSQGTVVFGPATTRTGVPADQVLLSEEAINRALRHLGVLVTPPCRDEFETIGFASVRRSEDWLTS